MEESIKSYLAGCFDCDGSLFITKDKKGRLLPRITFSSHNEDYLMTISNELKKLGLKNNIYRYSDKGKVLSSYLRLKTGYETTSLFFDKILPFLKLKKIQGELIREFINERRRFYNIDRKRDFRWRYSKRCYEIQDEIIKLNHRYMKNEHCRSRK